MESLAPVILSQTWVHERHLRMAQFSLLYYFLENKLFPLETNGNNAYSHGDLPLGFQLISKGQDLYRLQD